MPSDNKDKNNSLAVSNPVSSYIYGRTYTNKKISTDMTREYTLSCAPKYTRVVLCTNTKENKKTRNGTMQAGGLS